jgi:hypothetical protein
MPENWKWIGFALAWPMHRAGIEPATTARAKFVKPRAPARAICPHAGFPKRTAPLVGCPHTQKHMRKIIGNFSANKI